jgi:hypothetical protein
MITLYTNAYPNPSEFLANWYGYHAITDHFPVLCLNLLLSVIPRTVVIQTSEVETTLLPFNPVLWLFVH